MSVRMRNLMLQALLGSVALAGVVHMDVVHMGVARAEVVSSPAQALRLLTEARVAAEKCNWLDAAARRELTDYAARAELAAVKREGPEAVKRAVRQGRAKGNAGGCTQQQRELVTAVLQGAREAARRELPRTRRLAADVRRPVQRQMPRRVVRQQAHMAAVRNDHARGWRGRSSSPQVRIFMQNASRQADVRRYQALATAYYGALKCRNRPHAEMMRMWRQVREMHFAILRSGRKAALARAKAAAQRAGTARSCI